MSRGAGRGNVTIDGTSTVAISGTPTVTMGAVSISGTPTVTMTAMTGTVTIAGTPTAYIYGKTGDSTYQMPRLDVQTHAINTIEYEHHEIHAGSAFTCHFNNDVTNIGEQTAIAFKTPNTTKWIHVVAGFESTGAAYSAIYEDADLDLDEGTDLTVWNHDRNSLTASTVLTIETAPDAGKATSYTEAQISGATLSTASEIMRHYLGTNIGKEDPGGSGRSNGELILKQNTVYCFLINSLTADNSSHNITLNWYEHTNRTA